MSTDDPNLDLKPIAVPDVTGQPCEGCGTPTPYAKLSQPVGMAGSKRKLCPECMDAARDRHSESGIERNVRKRSTQAVSRTRTVISLAGSLDDETSPLPATLLNKMTDEAGGLERIAAIWWETILSLQEDKNRRMLLDELNRYAKLLVAVAPKVQESVSYRELSDEELAIQHRLSTERAFALRLLEQRPELKSVIEGILSKTAIAAEAATEEGGQYDEDEEDEDILDEEDEDAE